MKFISKAPLRIGLAGGGTDVSPYSDLFGGAVLNATISMYATVIITPRSDNKVVFNSINSALNLEFDATEEIPIHQKIKLQIGVYNHIVKNFTKKPIPCEIITAMDAPTGSGLGTSSTMVVAIIGAFVEMLNLPLGEYDIAQMAVKIEREELAMAGGKQDQYAATFGGFNFMEFEKDNHVIVNPLRIRDSVLRELEFHLLLFYSKIQRESSDLIERQKSNFEKKDKNAIDASHKLKEQAFKMKEAILKSELSEIGKVLNFGWINKKNLATGITNERIEDIYNTALASGALGGKISGAGGGGYMMFYCPGNTRYSVIDALAEKGASLQHYSFQKNGLVKWTSQQ